MYRESAPACATCGVALDPKEADLVDFGTGYRCWRCTTRGQISAHQARRPNLLDRAIGRVLRLLELGPARRESRGCGRHAEWRSTCFLCVMGRIMETWND